MDDGLYVKDEIDLRPQVWQIKLHFMQAGLHRWDNHRVKALCDKTRLTPFLLGANSGLFKLHIDGLGIPDLALDTAAIKSAWNANQWPVHLALAFDRLEAFVDSRPSVESVVTSELLRKLTHG